MFGWACMLLSNALTCIYTITQIHLWELPNITTHFYSWPLNRIHWLNWQCLANLFLLKCFVFQGTSLFVSAWQPPSFPPALRILFYMLFLSSIFNEMMQQSSEYLSRPISQSFHDRHNESTLSVLFQKHMQSHPMREAIWKIHEHHIVNMREVHWCYIILLPSCCLLLPYQCCLKQRTRSCLTSGQDNSNYRLELISNWNEYSRHLHLSFCFLAWCVGQVWADGTNQLDRISDFWDMYQHQYKKMCTEIKWVKTLLH